VEFVPELPQTGSVRAYGVDNFPAYFCFQVFDARLPYTVVLHVHTVEGRGKNLSAVTGQQIAPLPGEGIDMPLPAVSAVIAEMDVEEFVADAIGTKVGERLGLRPVDLLAADPDARANARELLQVALSVANSRRPRRYNLRGAALLNEVARVYIDAVNAGDAAPTRAVQQQVAGGHNGYSTAASWVRQARAAGLLPPAVKGRPGWKAEES
jgi:hypothetical protein